MDDTLAAVDPRSGPEKKVLDAERALLLRAAIDKLPEQQPECMAVMVEYRDAARWQGEPAST